MTITVAAAVSGGRVSLSVSSSPSVTAPLKVWRVHKDGSQYRVLTAGQAVLIGSWVGLDYHAPFNQPVTYVAEAGGVSSAASGPVWVISRQLSLIHPSTPALSMRFEKWAVDPFEYRFVSRAQQFDVLNRSEPVHRTSQPRGKASGSIRVKLDTAADRVAFQALAADGAQLLINSPFAEEVGWLWVQPGDVTIRNPTTFTQFSYRWGEFPFVASAQPVALQSPVWTYADLGAAGYASYTALQSAFTSYSRLELRLPG